VQDSLESGWITVVDTAVWLFGLEPLIWEAVSDSDFVKELLDIIYQWEKPRLEILLKEEVDLIVHSGWYEMPDLWSPRLFQKFIKPIIAKEVKLAHSAGVPFCYILTRGASLILEDLLETGVDVLRGIDPVQGGDDLASVKEKIGDQITIWGGMNAAITLGRGTQKEIREAVDIAIRTLAPDGGFVLYPVDQIYHDTPWENIQVMIEHWREIGKYPLKI
jgi:uroporphyrinogen-III decarboxylase